MFEVQRGAAPAPQQAHMLLPITGGADQQKNARQGERVETAGQPMTREALEGYLSEAEAVLADLGRSPLDQALRGITLRRIADLKERTAA